MCRSIVVALMMVVGAAGSASAQSQTEVVWTVSGSGVGFGVGLWAGLTAFDDAVDSDRKVWTSAIIGAGVGAVAGYLIGRAWTNRSRPSIVHNQVEKARRQLADQRLLEQLAKSFRIYSAVTGLAPDPETSGKGSVPAVPDLQSRHQMQ